MLLVGRTCIHRGWHVHTKWQLALHANHDRVLNSTYQEDKATSIYTKKKLAHVSLICSFISSNTGRSMASCTYAHTPQRRSLLHWFKKSVCMYMRSICTVRWWWWWWENECGISPIHRPRKPFSVAIDRDCSSFVLTLWVPWKPLDEPTYWLR